MRYLWYSIFCQACDRFLSDHSTLFYWLYLLSYNSSQHSILGNIYLSNIVMWTGNCINPELCLGAFNFKRYLLLKWILFISLLCDSKCCRILLSSLRKLSHFPKLFLQAKLLNIYGFSVTKIRIHTLSSLSCTYSMPTPKSLHPTSLPLSLLLSGCSGVLIHL